MAKENIDVLPVTSGTNHETIIGVLSYKDIINAHNRNMYDHVKGRPSISIKRRGLKMLVRGKRLMEMRIKHKISQYTRQKEQEIAEIQTCFVVHLSYIVCSSLISFYCAVNLS